MYVCVCSRMCVCECVCMYVCMCCRGKIVQVRNQTTTSWLKDRHATNFAKELSPLARIVIIPATHGTPYYILPPPNLCSSLNTGHPPLWRVLESSQSKPNLFLYHNTVSLALGDSTISGANVAEEKLSRSEIEPTAFWLKDRHATNFTKELSSLARIVIVQVVHRTPYYICMHICVCRPMYVRVYEITFIFSALDWKRKWRNLRQRG